MIEYLFIGLFVGAINTLWKVHLQDIGKINTPPSTLTFLVATVIWPLAIPLMIWKAIELGRT